MKSLDVRGEAVPTKLPRSFTFLEVCYLRELVFATILAEIKNDFVDEVSDPELIQLLYGGVAYPLGITVGQVSKGTASLIVNREPKGRPLKVIRGHCQDEVVKNSIGDYFAKNVIRHFIPGIEDDVIFRLRGIIKDANISDSRRNALLQLGKKDTFAEFLGQVFLASLLEDNVLTPEKKVQLSAELEEYKRTPLKVLEIPDGIISEERKYTSALVAVYAQAESNANFSLADIEQSKHARHFAEQRKYYFAAEAVRRGTRDIYQKEDQFDILKEETFEGVKEAWDEQYASGMARLKSVLKQAGTVHTDRCWLCRDTDWIGIAQKKGVCHFLVNDGSIDGWVRDDDECAI